MKKEFSKIFVVMGLLVSSQAMAAPTAVTLSTLASFTGTSTTNTPGTSGDRIAFGNFTGLTTNKGIVIASPGYALNKGRVYFKATASGTTPLSSMDVTITGATTATQLGAAIISTDINGDGCDDIIALGGGSGSATPTDIYTFLGSSSTDGIDNNGDGGIGAADNDPDWSGSYTLSSSVYHTKISSTEMGGMYYYLSLLGELDGPGTGNYLSICSAGGTCYLMPVANVTNTSGTMETNSTYTITGSNDMYNSIASGDIDGDDNEDVIVGNDGNYFDESITVLFGPLSSKSTTAFTAGQPASYDDIVIFDSDSSTSNYGFGDHVEAANIIKEDDNDDYDDLIIGSDDETADGNTGAGRYHIISGKSIYELRQSLITTYGSSISTTANCDGGSSSVTYTGILICNNTSTGTYNYSNLDVTYYNGDATNSHLGTAHNATAKSDLNGDGILDLVAGAKAYSGSTQYGRAYIIHTGDIQDLLGLENTLSSGDATSDEYLAGPSSSAALSSNVFGGEDVTGDGIDDVVISASGYNSSYGITYVVPGAATNLDGDPQDSVTAGVITDCNDKDPNVYVGATELDNDIDDDCNGVIDDIADADSDGVPDSLDTETCDGVDNTGDSVIDEGFDVDADGVTTCEGDYDDTDATIQSADLDNDGDGYSVTAGDCDDTNDQLLPGGPDGLDYEQNGDGLDNNCDGQIDDDDFDGDGYSWSDNDCDDDDVTANPGATESIDGVDNDCDGWIDDVAAGSADTDEDGDGYCDNRTSCSDGSTPGDCNDSDSAIKPGTYELYDTGGFSGDGVDENCDGMVNNIDYDGDGYYWSYVCQDAGRYYNESTPCELLGMTTIEQGNDCDDSNSSVHPDALESVTLYVDDDCDGLIDEAGTIGTISDDIDGDGYAEDQNGDGLTEVGEDCDDSNAAIYPGATEVDGDNIDNDCNGMVDDLDADGDGYYTHYICKDAGRYINSDSACASGLITTHTGGDCDDSDASVNPGASEVSGNSVDEDCDGTAEASSTPPPSSSSFTSSSSGSGHSSTKGSARSGSVFGRVIDSIRAHRRIRP